MLTKAVGTKEVLYDKVDGTPDIISRRAEVANAFEVRGTFSCTLGCCKKRRVMRTRYISML